MRGTICFQRIGRPQVVYGKRCNEDRLEHEVWVTEAELLLGGPFTRNVPVGQTFADALLIRDGERFFVEVDNESETLKQLRDKWQRYGDIDGFILVVCHTKARMRLLMRSADAVKSAALFTRFRWLRSGRIQEPWIDRFGKRVGI